MLLAIWRIPPFDRTYLLQIFYQLWQKFGSSQLLNPQIFTVSINNHTYLCLYKAEPLHLISWLWHYRENSQRTNTDKEGDNFTHVPATNTGVRQVSESPIEIAVVLKYAVTYKQICWDTAPIHPINKLPSSYVYQYTVELQWLKHFWDRERGN